MALTNGMIVKGSGPKVFLIENGTRRWIPDPPTLMTLGGWDAVQVVDDSILNTLPEGNPYPTVRNDPTVSRNAHKNLGSNHFMDTTAVLHGNGHIDATTRTRTGTWFGGFTGGVSLLFYDVNSVTIGQSSQHAFGVDGTAIGRSDRTDYWGEDIDPNVASRTASIDILQFWAPKWDAIHNIVKHAVDVGQTAGPLLAELKAAGII